MQTLSNQASQTLALTSKTRSELFDYIQGAIEYYTKTVAYMRVAPELNQTMLDALRAAIANFNFNAPRAPIDAVRFAIGGLTTQQVHTPHPRYFGLFNPAPSQMGVIADTLVAAFNPQMAAWSHSPFAAEIEAHLIRSLGEKFGYNPHETDGVFTSGGAEANHTALLTALVHKFPKFSKEGLLSVKQQPVIYVSTQAHHSFVKAARFCGLGTNAVRSIPTDDKLKMSIDALREQIAKDLNDACTPAMLVATAGTTSAGAFDDIKVLEKIAREEGMWFHVDAAWGGAAALVPELSYLLEGCEKADSITFDAHKFLSVPMAAGIYLTRHKTILQETCAISTAYMPLDAEGLDVTDPFTHSMQWSRRFTGLKLFLTLAVAGWEGYAETIRHQTAMGNLLRKELEQGGWRIVNDSPLPVVCFVDESLENGSTPEFLKAVAKRIVQSGEAWLSTTLLNGKTVLRACITNYTTQESDVQVLVRLLRRVAGEILNER
ncbi:MAG: pyridoxal phosphate-dependent decarboxylase family protein [Candidatus Kapaibacteriota bacterium]